MENVEETPVVVEAGEAEEVVAEEGVAVEEEEEVSEEETYDLDEAVRQTLKKARFTGTLYRGLREACRVLDSRQALFCILASDCDEKRYTTLVEALCLEYGTALIKVPKREDLGVWAGLCVMDAEGEARKKVKCSCVVVHQDIATEFNPAVNWLINYFKEQK